MRTFAQLALTITRDADQRQKLLETLLTLDDSNASTASTFSCTSVVLAASAADTAVNFTSVTKADTILIVAYSEIAVKLNGVGATAFRLVPVPAVATGSVLSDFQVTAQPGVLFIRGKVTSIHLTNPSSTAAAEALIVLVGEAA